MHKKLVFISHITEESELAKLISNTIKDSYLGMLDTFVSSDGESLPAGGRWLDKIDSALSESALQISLCSPQSIKRPWINFEAGASWIRRVPVIPICHSGLFKNQLPIPLALLQGADIENEEDLKVVFNQLTNTLGASHTPNIDYTSLIENSKVFSKEYTYTNKIKIAVHEIVDSCPDLNKLFFTGEFVSSPVNVQDYIYMKIITNLEILKNEDLIRYGFNRTTMGGGGTFRGGEIVVTEKYINEILPIVL